MDTEEGESSVDNYIQGHSAKKSKTEPQMQDENFLNENIQNEFDDGQEPFDVKEEMIGPQTVNHREEREKNQESGNLVVENVVSENEMEEIPEIKKEVKAEPEYIT
uniref:Uncharacterized protein n=1 Tax=Panagrolaimus davidi TaxID=227884 RepID=A0A914PLM9_9BILA